MFMNTRLRRGQGVAPGHHPGLPAEPLDASSRERGEVDEAGVDEHNPDLDSLTRRHVSRAL
jgi:hypothetical protein